ncbi:MAG: sigma-54-dependent Fis family transcriptional regulator [Nitrospinae bacterium]|nr:sigma-54-dependent Fis family transcriptional regulator [Nitrospinota bacterium]
MKQIDFEPNIYTIRKLSSLFAETHTEIDSLLNVVMEMAAKIVEAKNAALLMLDEKTNKLKFFQASGDKGEQLRQFEIPPGVGLAGIAVETGKPIVSNDVQNDRRWFREVSETTRLNVKSIACFPVKIDHKPVGVIQFLDKLDGEGFTERDQEILSRFADMLARFFQISKSRERLGQEFDRLKQKYLQKYTIVGESPAIRKCVAYAERVAESKASVLITGESGTGKELIAHLIHERSRRQNKPFISVSCGALPGSILERELFGHEKGAFTGADSRKIGLFEAADGGTLFLDEIGEMPLDMQVKLLRVIQEEAFMRLGGTALIKVDVRILSATHQDLEKMVGEGKFRQDLFYRINVINIKLPALRERPEDIPDLVAFFLRKHKQDERPVKKLGKGAMSHLMGYSWPGNIRQLENAVERAIVLEEGEELTLDSFPFEERPQSSIEVGVGATLKDANDAFRKSFIKNTLKSTGGNRTKAARILDVQRSYLSRLIKELNID